MLVGYIAICIMMTGINEVNKLYGILNRANTIIFHRNDNRYFYNEEFDPGSG